jgi:predicted Ser/Thr protein kinase
LILLVIGCRIWILNAADALHACGVQHNDLYERNFRIDNRNQKAWIVDFENASEHACRHQPITVGEIEPIFSRFGCSEIYELASDLRIWLSLGKFRLLMSMISDQTKLSFV